MASGTEGPAGGWGYAANAVLAIEKWCIGRLSCAGRSVPAP
jgi:hypothetical protein